MAELAAGVLRPRRRWRRPRREPAAKVGGWQQRLLELASDMAGGGWVEFTADVAGGDGS